MFEIKKPNDVVSYLNKSFFSFTDKAYKEKLDKSYKQRINDQRNILLNNKFNNSFLTNFRHPLSKSIIVEQHLFNGYPRPKISEFKKIIKYYILHILKYLHPFYYAEKDWLKWSFNRYKLCIKNALKNDSLNFIGNPPYINTKNFKWNLRHLRYLIIRETLYSTLGRKKISDIKSVLDIGGCYGGYISLLAKDNPHRSYVLVDLAENIPLAAYYLSSAHPSMRINVLTHKGDKCRNIPNTFTLIPAHLFKSIKFDNFDLLCNFVSLAEMSRVHFDEYVNSEVYKNSKYLHLVNRIVSAPFFSRGSNPHTWMESSQNYFDYGLGFREDKFFDIFPLYHFFPMAEDKNNNPLEYKFTTIKSFFLNWTRSPITSQYFQSITEFKT